MDSSERGVGPPAVSRSTGCTHLRLITRQRRQQHNCSLSGPRRCQLPRTVQSACFSTYLGLHWPGRPCEMQGLARFLASVQPPEEQPIEPELKADKQDKDRAIRCDAAVCSSRAKQVLRHRRAAVAAALLNRRVLPVLLVAGPVCRAERSRTCRPGRCWKRRSRRARAATGRSKATW